MHADMFLLYNVFHMNLYLTDNHILYDRKVVSVIHYKYNVFIE